MDLFGISMNTIYITCFIIFGIISSWAVLANMNIPKLRGKIPKGFVIFITGTNGVGKTSTAIRVSKKLGMRVIEINSLRQALRSQKMLFEKAGDIKNYNLLKKPTYSLDEPKDTYPIVKSDFQKQCELLSPVITGVAEYYTKEQVSTVFEGINILPTMLNIPCRYVLFVHLYIGNEQALKKRLDRKAYTNADKGNLYDTRFHIILKTAQAIKADFDSIQEIKVPNPEIHKLSIDTHYLSIRKVTKEIIREVRKICDTSS